MGAWRQRALREGLVSVLLGVGAQQRGARAGASGGAAGAAQATASNTLRVASSDAAVRMVPPPRVLGIVVVARDGLDHDEAIVDYAEREEPAVARVGILQSQAWWNEQRGDVA